ncbi:MAG: DUF1934 domain-containing protein [Clostridia bacterium]|nr:DUF1934 domain-containing protein [Clostridia bacterium]
MNVTVRFCSRQTVDGETSQSSLVALGTLESTKNGVKLCYTEESDRPATVCVSVSGKRVMIARRGETSFRLILEENTSHACRLQTPYGTMELSVTTTQLSTDLSAAGGTLHARYALEFDGGLTENEVEFLVEEVPTC